MQIDALQLVAKCGTNIQGAIEMVVAQFPVTHIRQSSLNKNKIEWW